MGTYIVRNFEAYHSELARHAIAYYEKSPYELIIRMDDGTIKSYYDEWHTVRTIPNYNECMSEEEISKEFGLRLTRILAYESIGQTELSVMTGISQANISRYCSGKSLPNFYNLVKISQALDCSLDDFTPRY